MESKVEEIFQKVKNCRMENSKKKSEENWRTNSGGPISKQDFKKTSEIGRGAGRGVVSKKSRNNL